MGSSAQGELCDRGREASEGRERQLSLICCCSRQRAVDRSVMDFRMSLNTSADLQRRWPATNAAPRAKGAELYIKHSRHPSPLSLCDLHSLTPDICKVVTLLNERAASPLLSSAHSCQRDSHVSLFCSFFQDGLKTADKLKQYIEKLAADLYNVNTSFLISSSAFPLVSLVRATELITKDHIAWRTCSMSCI